MGRKVRKAKSEVKKKIARSKRGQTLPPRQGKVVKKQQSTAWSKRNIDTVKTVKTETCKHIRIKLFPEVTRRSSKRKKHLKNYTYNSNSYKRVGLDNPTSLDIVAELTENERIKCAMDDLAKGKFQFVSKAAAYWRVHAAKLYRRQSGGVPLVARRGPRKGLTDGDEGALVDWVVTMGKRGFHISPRMVRDAIKQFFKKEQNHFLNGRPSHTWYHRFVERHPELQGFGLSRLTAICKENLSKAVLDEWFREFEEFLEDCGVVGQPEQIFSFAQTKFEVNKRTQRIVLRSCGPADEVTNLSDVCATYNTEVTVNMCASADGHLVPPFIICQSLKRLPKDCQFLEGSPSGTGNMLLQGYLDTEDSFAYWIENHIVPNIGGKRPLVLLVHLDEREISYGAYAAATKHDIQLFRVPPEAASLLQPLNTGKEGSFSSNWLKQWVARNRHVPVSFHKLGSMIGEAWMKADNPDAIRECFIRSGIYPLDREMVDNETLPKENSTSNVLEVVSATENTYQYYDILEHYLDNSDSKVDNANDSISQDLFEEQIPESNQPIAALLAFQKLDDSLDKSTQEMYRTCVENGLDFVNAPMFQVWKKLYMEAFRNDPNVPLTSAKEEVVSTTTVPKPMWQDSAQIRLLAGVLESTSAETVCPVCCQQFSRDDDKWIGCTGDCRQWFHIPCIPRELATPGVLEDKEMVCPDCGKSEKMQGKDANH